MEGFLQTDTFFVMFWDKGGCGVVLVVVGGGGSSCFQMRDTCVQIWAGWEKQREQSTRTGFGPQPEKQRLN